MLITIYPNKLINETDRVESASLYLDPSNRLRSPQDRSCVTIFYIPEGKHGSFCKRVSLAESGLAAFLFTSNTDVLKIFACKYSLRTVPMPQKT